MNLVLFHGDEEFISLLLNLGGGMVSPEDFRNLCMWCWSNNMHIEKQLKPYVKDAFGPEIDEKVSVALMECAINFQSSLVPDMCDQIFSD